MLVFLAHCMHLLDTWPPKMWLTFLDHPVYDISCILLYVWMNAAGVEQRWVRRMTRARRRLTWPSRMDTMLLLRSLQRTWASRLSTECPSHEDRLLDSPTNFSELVHSMCILSYSDRLTSVHTFARHFYQSIRSVAMDFTGTFGWKCPVGPGAKPYWGIWVKKSLRTSRIFVGMIIKKLACHERKIGYKT